MTNSCRALLLVLVATTGCDSGPTSDWPGTDGNSKDQDEQDDEPPHGGLDGGQSAMDAGKADAGRSIEDCGAPDASEDAGCAARDF